VKSPRQVNPSVPARLDKIVRKLLAKKPGQRYASSGELLGALGVETQGSSTTNPTAPTAALSVDTDRSPLNVVAIVAILAVLGIGLTYGAYRYFGTSTAPRPAGGGAAPPAAPQSASDPAGVASPDDAAEELVAATDATTAEPEDGAAPSTTDASEADTSSTVSGTGGTASADADSDESADSETAVAPVAETFQITSRPEGATVTVDGTAVDDVTPVEVDFLPGSSYQLGIALDGYEATGFEFNLEDLDAAQRDSATLHFPLQPDTPPGTLQLRSTYPVTARVGGRSYDIQAGGELQLQPGSYEVEFEAPDVFFADTRRVTVASDEVATVILPPAVAVTIGATPSYCRVRIDGRDVGFVPVTLDIAVGAHELRFDWDRLGESQTLQRTVRSDTERIFVSANENERPD